MDNTLSPELQDKHIEERQTVTRDNSKTTGKYGLKTLGTLRGLNKKSAGPSGNEQKKPRKNSIEERRFTTLVPGLMREKDQKPERVCVI